LTGPFNILLTSAGRRVSLARLLRADAAALGFEPRLIVAEMHPGLSAAACAADARHAVPAATHADYIPALLDICRREAVRLLVPTIDTELNALAAHRAEFEAAGVLVNVSSAAAIDIARNKAETARVLSQAGIGTPRTAWPHEVLAAPNDWDWPLIFKPKGGSSSVGLHRVGNVDQLAEALAAYPDGIVQDLIRGPEYTVNMFVDPDGVCRAAVPHLRRELRGGEVSKGITVRRQNLTDTAHAIAAALPGAFGALCFQAFATDSGPVVFEINARFGGGFPLAHQAGTPFTRWLIQLAAGSAPDWSDDWTDGTTMLRYDDAVFGVADPEERAAWLG
jgi:carbamoyl-phosphate synthase large subunit